MESSEVEGEEVWCQLARCLGEEDGGGGGEDMEMYEERENN